MHRRTKIVATLGPSTKQKPIIEKMLIAGVDCFRINCSHSDKKELEQLSSDVRQTAKELNKAVALMVDLQGPKLRLQQNINNRFLQHEEKIILIGRKNPTIDGAIKVEVDDITELVTEKSEIVIGDGTPRLKADKVGEDKVLATVIAAGEISASKGISVTFSGIVNSSLTEKDLNDLDTAAAIGVDYIALSFVREAEDIAILRAMLAERESKALLIAKIEKLEAVSNIEEICRVADGLLVARGDYGVEAGLAAVPLMQKTIIQTAKKTGTLVITATQMLESMIQQPLPTRAEASDVANAVIDGSSAVMLSAETAIGKYPIQAIQAMQDIIMTAESHDDVYSVPQGPIDSNQQSALMHSAVLLATETNAQAILVPTESGASVRACARYRPRQPIIALTPYKRVVDQLKLEWGVQALVFQGTYKLENLIEESIKIAKKHIDFNTDTPVVISAGNSGEANSTNFVTVKFIY